MDAQFGLVYLRVPTWVPFRLQFYCNGHSWLARRLTAEGINHTMADNAFIRIDDWVRAQELADSLSPDRLHRTLDRYAAKCCPVFDVFKQSQPNRWRWPRPWSSAGPPAQAVGQHQPQQNRGGRDLASPRKGRLAVHHRRRPR